MPKISRCVESLVRQYLDDTQASCLWVSHDRSQCDTDRRAYAGNEWLWLAGVSMIQLSSLDLALAALLVVALALTSLRVYPGMASQLLIAGLRTLIQLTLIGLVLKSLFESASLLWVALLSLVMLAVAGREVMARQHRRFAGSLGLRPGRGIDVYFVLHHCLVCLVCRGRQ